MSLKHFSLWDRVTQDPYKSIIENRIKKLVELKLEKNNFNNIVDLYESLEWEERHLNLLSQDKEFMIFWVMIGDSHFGSCHQSIF